MSVVEVVEDPGRFTLRLDTDKTPDSVMATIDPWGHIVICPQRLFHPNWHADADILSTARYSGVVLDKDYDRESSLYTVRGRGMAYWLGNDKRAGPVLFQNKTYDGTAVDDVLKSNTSGGILPPGVTAGTITTTGVGTLTTDFEEADRPIDALRTVAQQLKLAWRVNPNGTLDACLNTRDEVFKTTASAIKYAVVREGWGDDPKIKSVQAVQMRTSVDANDYATRAIVIGEQYDGSRQIVAFKNRDSIPYKDIHGNELVWNQPVTIPSSDSVDIDDYLSEQLDDYDLEFELDVEALEEEFANGQAMVGDHFFVFDSPSVRDETNGTWHRGRYLPFKIIQATRVEWYLRQGMDVLYRDGDAAYTRLTPYVRWER